MRIWMSIPSAGPLGVLGALILFSGPVHSAGAAGSVRLPVIDKQDIRFLQISADGGSFQSRVASIAQDRFGFMWFGTDDGLYRYDGYKLKLYRRERGDPNSLSDDTVRTVYCDRAGILWIGTGFGGLDRLDPASATFTHYRHDPANRGSLADDRINYVYQDTSGALWVGTAGGLDRRDAASGTFVHYTHNPRDGGSLSSNAVVHIFEDHLGNLWAGTIGGGVNRLDRGTGRFSRFHDPNNPRSPGDDRDLSLSCLREDHSGVLWAGFALSTLDPNTGSLTPYALRSKERGGEMLANVRSILEDRDGKLWLGTVNGLLALDRERKQFVRYVKDPANPHSLHNDDILFLFEDAEGNIWVGGQSGVSWFNPKPRFISYVHESGNSQSLSDNSIRAVQVDSQGAIWVGTRRGLQRLDLKTGRFKLYQHDPDDPHSLSNNYVTVIREDRSGTLWVGTGGGGLDRFDRATGRFSAYRYRPNSPAGLSSDGVLSLFEDREGMLWVATAAGLNRWDRRSGRFISYRHNPEDPHSLSDDWIKTVFEDRSGILWVGSHNGGLNRFDRASRQFTAYRHNPKDLGSLSHDQVNAIWEDRNGTLWVATEDGLDQMDRGRGTFTTYTRKDGLPDNAIQAILEDDQGSLWLFTHNGLSQFLPQSRTFRNYFESDGLPGNLLGPTGAEGSCRGPGGAMWFGSRNGLTSFYPDRISVNPFVPPVVLTGFNLFNRPVQVGAHSPLQKPIWATDSLTLTHNQSIFTLEFAALSYMAPANNRYRYRLEGLEPEWNQVDSGQRLATYTSLPAGRYVFRVQASNNDGVWNDTGANLPVTMLPPWWATWWLRSIIGLSISGLAFAGYRSRVRSLRLGAARLEAQVSERTGELVERTRELQIAKDAAEAANRAKTIFLATMSHELRTPLNAILGFSSLLREGTVSEEQRHDLDIINRSGEHLLKLINEVLDVAKIEAGRGVLEITPCELTGVVRDVMDMMRGRAEAKNLALLMVQSLEFPRYVQIDVPKLRQVLINLLGNAIKYTERGSVTLRLDAACAPIAGWLLLTFAVEDTGIGITGEDRAHIFEAFVQVGKQTAQRGTGLGLTISRQFVELMGGTIHAESTPGEGSRFYVKLPVERAEESEATAPSGDGARIIGLEPGEPEYRILVVDDERENRLMLERLLAGAGFHVRVAENGAQGVELFQTWRPHFIWMDLRMPVLDGVTATRQIRALEGGREVKIAAITASVFEDQRSEVLAAGLDDFVGKPYWPSEIFDCVGRHLGVRYRQGEAAPVEPAAALQPEALEALPAELLRELRDALVALHAERIAEIIARVSERDSILGSALARFANRFAYTAIFEAIEACRANGERSITASN
ncbi:MAG TPA: two-component regulator propeller domain-containing protein [Bryobacteraceae bacterium]|nr:two-component regulator propeller domain-containing protein [Bryobacteraceae bacterium]